MTHRQLAALGVLAALLAMCGPAAAGLYTEGGDVEVLDAGNFDEMVTESGDFWLVEFYAPWCGHCKKLTPEWKQAAKELKGVARLGAVDCDEEKEMGSRFGVKGFPTIKAFGDDKTKPEDYQSARDASSIVQWVKDKVGGGGGGGGGSTMAPEVPYLKVHQFLHMNDPSAPKAILFYEGKSAPSWISSLAVKYKEGRKRSVYFAVSSETQVASRFGIKEFPAMVVAAPDGSGSGTFATWDSLKIAEKGSENVKKGKEFVDKVVGNELKESDVEVLPAFPPPDVPRKLAETSYAGLSEDNIDTHCFGGKKSLCVIAFVAAVGSRGSEEFTEDAALLELSKKYRNDPISFVWVNFADQKEFASGFSVESSPALVAVKSGKRARFARHEGDITLKSVSGFLDKILGGDLQFKALKKLPDFEPEYLKGQ